MVYKLQPMMSHTPNERMKTHEMAKMNLHKETSLEEEVIEKMAPVRKDFIRDDSGSNFKPVYASISAL